MNNDGLLNLGGDVIMCVGRIGDECELIEE